MWIAGSSGLKQQVGAAPWEHKEESLSRCRFLFQIQESCRSALGFKGIPPEIAPDMTLTCGCKVRATRTTRVLCRSKGPRCRSDLIACCFPWIFVPLLLLGWRRNILCALVLSILASRDLGTGLCAPEVKAPTLPPPLLRTLLLLLLTDSNA